MDEDESSEDAGRIERLQRQARRRLVNRHAAHQSTDTTATLPEYTSSPPKYPLTAEEADEERDEVGDVVRRVRLRRKRSGSDSYLDSLLARSVHALELSNALLQSSMTTQSSLSALLSHDDNTLDRSLDSHARFLASQIQASDSRRAFVDDITRHLDTTLSASPLGLSQSLPDTQNTFLSQDPSPRKRDSGLQQGDRPRSPPPRCMTVYADTSLPSDTILIPSTNGLRSLARVHDFVPTSRNHSRQSSVSDEGVFARQQGYRTPPRTARRTSSIQTHSSNPSTSTGYSVYQHGNGNVSSPVLSSPHRIARRTRSQLLPHSPVQQQQFSSHQPAGPVQPVLSSLPAEPSTAAYNLLSSIATRSPSASESEAPRKPSLDTGTVRGRGAGKFAPLGIAHKSSGAGLRRTRSVTPSGSALASPLVPDSRMQADSPASSRLQADSPFSTRQADSPFTTRVPVESLFPPQTDSPSSTRSKPSRSGSTTSSIPTTSQHTPISPNRRVVRHPFLQPPHPHDSSVSDTEGDGRKLQRYKSAQVLRRILDVAQQKAEEEAARKREEELRAAEEAKERGRPSRRPTWSVIPRTATVAVETVASEGIVSIQGMAGGGTSSRGQSTLKVVTEPDPLVLPGEFSVSGSSVAGPSTARTSTTGTFLSPAESAARSIPQRSQSAGPSNRVATLLGASLPKISVFGIGAVGEPPPDEPESAKLDKGKGKAVDSPSPRPALRLRLNSTDVDMDAEAVNSSDSECESQPSQASLHPARLFDSTSSIARPSSLRLPGSPRSGTSTPRSVTFSPLPPRHISSGRPMSDAKTRRKKPKKEEEKPGWFASWFGPLPAKSAGYGPARRGWDSPRSMDDWQM